MKSNSPLIFVLLISIIIFSKSCICKGPTKIPRKSITDTFKLSEKDSITQNLIFWHTYKIQHKELLGRNKYWEKSGKGYLLTFEVLINDRKYSETVYEQKADEDINLNEFRDLLKYKISNDRKHLLVTKKNKPIGVYHLFDKGGLFFIPQDEKLFTDTNINSMTEPIDLICNYISKTEGKDQNKSDEYIQRLIMQQDINSPLNERLLEYPGSLIVQNFFKEDKRTFNLSVQNKKWRKKAISKVLGHLKDVNYKNKASLIAASTMVELYINGLNNYIDKEKMDQLILPGFPYFEHTTLYYSSIRSYKIKPEYLGGMKYHSFQVLRNSKKNIFSISEKRRKELAQTLITFLLENRIKGNVDEFKNIAKAGLKKEIFEWDESNIYPFFAHTSKYDSQRLTDQEKSIVKEYTQKLIKELEKNNTKVKKLEEYLKELNNE